MIRLSLFIFVVFIAAMVFARPTCLPYSGGFGTDVFVESPVWVGEPYDITAYIQLFPADPGCPPHPPQTGCTVTATLPDGSIRTVTGLTIKQGELTKVVFEDVLVSNCTPIDMEIGAVWIRLKVQKPPFSPSIRDYTYSIRSPDLCCDTHVGVQDILMVIGAWGACPTTDGCWEDITVDGYVGVPDLLFVINRWGTEIN